MDRVLPEVLVPPFTGYKITRLQCNPKVNVIVDESAIARCQMNAGLNPSPYLRFILILSSHLLVALIVAFSGFPTKMFMIFNFSYAHYMFGPLTLAVAP
jgi:hypothetical protein